MAEGLRRAGATVDTCVDGRRRRSVSFLRALRRVEPDLVLVGFPGPTDLPAVAAWCRRAGVPLAIDALVSLRETYIEDRRRLPSTSARARLLPHFERITLGLADLVIVDTESHRHHFVDEVGVPPGRVEVMRLADRSPDHVEPPGRDGLEVLWYGSHLRLHRADVVVEAALLVERIDPTVRFRLVGVGPTRDDVEARAARCSNVVFDDRVAPADLQHAIHASHVCLGIFPTSGKGTRVVPHKVVDGLLAGRPVITAATPAIDEVLVAGRDLLTVPGGDPRALADAVLSLRDPHRRAELGRNARAAALRHHSLERLAADWSAVLERRVGVGRR